MPYQQSVISFSTAFLKGIRIYLRLISKIVIYNFLLYPGFLPWEYGNNHLIKL